MRLENNFQVYRQRPDHLCKLNKQEQPIEGLFESSFKTHFIKLMNANRNNLKSPYAFQNINVRYMINLEYFRGLDSKLDV